MVTPWLAIHTDQGDTQQRIDRLQENSLHCCFVLTKPDLSSILTCRILGSWLWPNSSASPHFWHVVVKKLPKGAVSKGSYSAPNGSTYRLKESEALTKCGFPAGVCCSAGSAAQPFKTIVSGFSTCEIMLACSEGWAKSSGTIKAPLTSFSCEEPGCNGVWGRKLQNYSHPGAATQISGGRDMGLPKWKKLICSEEGITSVSQKQKNFKKRRRKNPTPKQIHQNLTE